MLNWIKFLIVGGLLSLTLTSYFASINKAKELERYKAHVAAMEASNKALEAQGEIALNALLVEQEKNDEIKKLTADAEFLRISLQQRPSRPQTIYINTEVASSCTGRELYKEDGEFLVREAARAQSVVAERNYYYQQYEQVRKKLNEFNESN